MIEGERPQTVLRKSESQTITCSKCQKGFEVPTNVYKAPCPFCQTLNNWGLGQERG